MSLLTGILAKFKRSHATEPPLIVQQISTGFIQQWTQGEATINGTEKARIENDGKFVTSGAITSGSPHTISGATPTLIFEDTTGGDDDLQFVANADALLLEIVGGTDIANFSATGTTILAPLTVDGTTDILLKANGYIVGYPRTIHVNTASTGNVGGGTDDLHQFTLPANSLATDGDFLEIEYAGTIGANDNNKFVSAVIDGTTYEDGGGGLDFDGANTGSSWRYITKIVRTSATEVRTASLLMYQFFHIDSAAAVTSFSDGGAFFTRNQLVTVANLGANAIVLKAQAGGTADNDVVQNMSVIKVCQMT